MAILGKQPGIGRLHVHAECPNENVISVPLRQVILQLQQLRRLRFYFTSTQVWPDRIKQRRLQLL